MSNVETTPCAGGFSELRACSLFRSAASGVDHRMVSLRDSAVRAWQEREPQTWAMVCDWLAAQGKSVVQV
jgi:hypothetical protein